MNEMVNKNCPRKECYIIKRIGLYFVENNNIRLWFLMIKRLWILKRISSKNYNMRYIVLIMVKSSNVCIHPNLLDPNRRMIINHEFNIIHLIKPDKSRRFPQFWSFLGNKDINNLPKLITCILEFMYCEVRREI